MKLSRFPKVKITNIETDSRRRRIVQLYSQICRVKFKCVPAHCGITDDEMADTLTRLDLIPVNYEHVKYNRIQI